MGKILISTGFNIDLEFEIAPFHTRMIAWIIDLMLQVFYIMIVYRVYGAAAGIYAGNISGYDMWALQLIILLPVFTYHFFCELFWNGQSVGKKLLGIRVVNDNGGKASPGQYMIRWLLRSSDLSIPVIIIAVVFGWFGALKALLITGLMFITDLLLVALNKKSKRLGDLAAGTLLIKANPKGNLEDTIFMDMNEAYVPVFNQVMRLSDRDVNIIKSILDTSRKTGQKQMVENTSDRVKKALDIETAMPASEFLETLLMDYNFLATKE